MVSAQFTDELQQEGPVMRDSQRHAAVSVLLNSLYCTPVLLTAHHIITGLHKNKTK